METVDDGGGTTDGAPVAPPRKKRATELTRQKLFHYMPTLHSSSSFWRDGWQAGLITRQTDTRTQSVRVWDFLWSEERKGMERVERAVLERKSGIIKCSSVHTVGRLRQMLPPGSDSKQFSSCLPYCQIIIIAIAIIRISTPPQPLALAPCSCSRLRERGSCPPIYDG